MNCLRCGREVTDDQAFCPQCLELMEKHPVRPDTVVKLPQRRDTTIKKAPPRKKVLTAEEQVVRLKRKNRWLTVILCVILAVSLLLAYGAPTWAAEHQAALIVALILSVLYPLLVWGSKLYGWWQEEQYLRGKLLASATPLYSIEDMKDSRYDEYGL